MTCTLWYFVFRYQKYATIITVVVIKKKKKKKKSPQNIPVLVIYLLSVSSFLSPFLIKVSSAFVRRRLPWVEVAGISRGQYGGTGGNPPPLPLPGLQCVMMEELAAIPPPSLPPGPQCVTMETRGRGWTAGQ